MRCVTLMKIAADIVCVKSAHVATLVLQALPAML